MERQFIIYSKSLLEDNAFYNKMESVTDDSKYLFKAKTTQAYAVRSTFELCNAGLSDATMEFSPSGIKLTTVNNTVICKTLVCLKLKSENFDEFICNEEIDVPITLAHFYRVLKSVSKKNKYLMPVFYLASEPPEVLSLRTYRTTLIISRDELIVSKKTGVANRDSRATHKILDELLK